MMKINIGPIKGLFLAACASSALTAFVLIVLFDDTDQRQKMLTMEIRIKGLEKLLAVREEELKNVRLIALRQNGQNKKSNVTTVNEICQQVKENQTEQYQQNNGVPSIVDGASSSTDVLKYLGTNSVNDSRSFTEKANDLLLKDSTKASIAIVSKGIFDMAGDRDSLPDYALQSMYSNQSDPDLKRVIAQVLSNRGNNTLIDHQIAETQVHLNSDSPIERQKALVSLAKTHSSNAANAIVPLLQDSSIDVKLDALLALRATGNQTHVSLVEKLLNDPDRAVSSLASEVASNLKNLSDSARTTVISTDIAAELISMDNP